MPLQPRSEPRYVACDVAVLIPLAQRRQGHCMLEVHGHDIGVSDGVQDRRATDLGRTDALVACCPSLAFCCKVTVRVRTPGPRRGDPGRSPGETRS
jgi:hypothetical protein